MFYIYIYVHYMYVCIYRYIPFSVYVRTDGRTTDGWMDGRTDGDMHECMHAMFVIYKCQKGIRPVVPRISWNGVLWGLPVSWEISCNT